MKIYNSFTSRLPFVLVVLLILHGCSNPGKLRDAQDDTEFATDRSTRLIIRTPENNAYEVRTLSGEYLHTLVRTRYALLDVDSRGERFLMHSSVGFSAGQEGGAVRPLAVGPAWGNVAINGSGTRIAMTNNRERLIRVLSFDTLELLLEISCPDNASCRWLGWDVAAPNILWFTALSHNDYEQLDLTTGESVSVPRESHPMIRYPGETLLYHLDYCQKTGDSLNVGDNGIALSGPGRSPKSLVTIHGKRESMFGERFPSIDRAGFIEECRYVIFGFGGNDWLIDVESARTGRLPGKVWYVLPAAEERRLLMPNPIQN